MADSQAMKTIGVLGGMSWESTQTYYRLLNEGVKTRLGGLHSARIVLYSLDFAEIEALQRREDWPQMGQILSRAAQALEAAGADFLLLATNTMHRVAPDIEAAISVPLLHIADATANVLQAEGVNRVGLLGTRFTMEQPFYRERLEAHDIEVIVPSESERAMVDETIFAELCLGVINDETRARYLQIIEALADAGVQAVILGCTEIGLLVRSSDTSVPLHDTAAIHCEQALRYALADH